MAAHFPPNAPRPDPAGLPTPLALTLARLAAEVDRQEPVAAAWQLRDAFECLLKFAASVAAADALHADPDPALAARLAGLLLKPTGLSLGDWHTLLEIVLEPLRYGQGPAGRLVPDLAPLFFQADGDPTPLNRAIDGDADSFVKWRNEVFGHGVFRQDRAWYAAETVRWLPRLAEFVDGVRSALAGRVLASDTPGGERVEWVGPVIPSTTPRHEHQPWGEPLPLRLADPGGGPDLPLTPLLSVQACAACGEPAVFFFDRHRWERDKDRHRTHLLEYFGGHAAERRDWADARRLAGQLPPEFRWKRETYDGGEADAAVGAVFRDFDTEYHRPDHLLDAVWAATRGRPKGYVHVVGPGGVGKSFLVRGLAAEGGGRGVPVLTYHVLPGARADYRTFMAELDAAARERCRMRSPGLQAKGLSRQDLAAEFAEYAGKLMSGNKLKALVIAVDGLDVLSDPEGRDASVVDFLPSPADLPARCFVVLTSRPELRPYTAAAVERLKRGAGAGWVVVAVDAGAAGNRDLLRRYLADRLPEALRSERLVEEVLDRSGGVFLYAYHLCRALAAGAFTGDDLPAGREFYPAYLGRLRERVGNDLYATVYEPTLLLLAAAYRPVTLGQLERWGVPGARLRFALLDLADFLRVHRTKSWHESLSDEPGEDRYEVAHEEFVRFVREDAGLSEKLRAAHGRIAKAALARHGGRWDQLDPTDDADLYDLRFVLAHAREGRIPEAGALADDEGFIDSSFETISDPRAGSRFRLAVELTETLLPVAEARAAAGGADADARLNLLASLLSNICDPLCRLGRVTAALAAQERALTIFRDLATRDFTRWGPNLATSLYHRTSPLRTLGRFAEALQIADEALGLFGRLAEDRPAEGALWRATVLNTRGGVLFSLRRYEEAEADFAAVEAALLSIPPDPEHASLLALSRFNRGNALVKLRRVADGLASYDAAVADYRALTATDPTDLPRLADLLARRANLRSSSGEYPREDFDEAVAILRGLIDRDGRADAAQELCQVLAEMTKAAYEAGDHTLALETAGQRVSLERKLRADGWERSEVELADPLVLRALAAEECGHPAVVVECAAEALQLYVSATRAGNREAGHKLGLVLREAWKWWNGSWWRPALWPEPLATFLAALAGGCIARRGELAAGDPVLAEWERAGWRVLALGDEPRAAALAGLTRVEGLSSLPGADLLRFLAEFTDDLTARREVLTGCGVSAAATPLLAGLKVAAEVVRGGQDRWRPLFLRLLGKGVDAWRRLCRDRGAEWASDAPAWLRTLVAAREVLSPSAPVLTDLRRPLATLSADERAALAGALGHPDWFTRYFREEK